MSPADMTERPNAEPGHDDAFLRQNLASKDPVETDCMVAMIRIAASHGLRGMSAERISQRAGVEPAAFCERFASLEGCFVHAYELSHFALVAAMREAQQTLPASTTWARRVEGVTDTMLSFFAASHDSAIALLGEIEYAGPVARMAHLQALNHLSRLNRRLYELRRHEDPDQPQLPMEIFELGTHGISRMVLGVARRRRVCDIARLKPALVHVFHGLFACGRGGHALPDTERLIP